MSAHETTCGQIPSICALMLSITSNPRRELLFGAAVFSPVNVGVSSSSTEPSQPCIVRILKVITLINGKLYSQKVHASGEDQMGACQHDKIPFVVWSFDPSTKM
ncbi:Os12g0111750 [Oryza sativa Japonica Group]|uniref:Os12g0111750 protein n=1 Tax=Oryza sativa subsp. japonica TaxID=39947 RepID=A0A0P0Y687_ORYSJ|nr:Os12g0111750 [Oryza sativa Japonica Group]